MTINKRARGRKARCPYCKGFHTHRKGMRHTVELGDQPLRYCTDCERKFTLQQPGKRRTKRRARPVVGPTNRSNTADASMAMSHN